VDASKVAVATITWARSAGEEALLVRSLALLADGGWPMAIADRRTSAAFTSRLEALPNALVAAASEPGLVRQVKASLDLAATFERPFILYVEPDKELFFGPQVTAFVQRAPDAGDVGVVLASRSDESFRTFPPMQRYTEGVVNHLCAEMIGREGDYSYGPFLINRALLPHVARVDDQVGWGWRHLAFRTAQRHGFSIHHVTGDYPCPPDQRVEGDAERMHRMRQLSENILGLIG
jgi:hypothetical protein